MGAIYSGIVSRDGYVFATNDIFGASPDECAIVRVNSRCGGFIVTAKGNLLSKVMEVLKACLSRLHGMPEGISEDHATAIKESFLEERRKEPDGSQRPLPFLLLLVGYHPERPGSLEHIFIRNRVTDILEKSGTKEYITCFDMRPPVPSGNLFYGHSELSRYLSRQLPSDGLEGEITEILSYLSIAETQIIDKSLFPGIRMATLSDANGFAWVGEEVLHGLAEKSRKADGWLTQGLINSFFRQVTNRHINNERERKLPGVNACD